MGPSTSLPFLTLSKSEYPRVVNEGSKEVQVQFSPGNRDCNLWMDSSSVVGVPAVTVTPASMQIAESRVRPHLHNLLYLCCCRHTAVKHI